MRAIAVGYRSDADLIRVVADGRATVLHRIRALHVAEVVPHVADFAANARSSRGIRFVQRPVRRRSHLEPALFAMTNLGVPYEWQFAATHADGVPLPVVRAASSVTIAVIDTGVDLTAPDISAKAPRVVSLRGIDARDLNGHGTFVSSLAAGSVTNSEGMAGFGGDARLLVIKASRNDGSLTDLDEANAIVYAVDHGARVINLSVGGPDTSYTERRGIQYAADHGVLVVAAAGNEHDQGNPVEYPAGLVQPPGSNGRGGVGLAVGATTMDGGRASFSNTGSQLSLAAPGKDVFSAVSSFADPHSYPRIPLPGSLSGNYGFASGTSFAAPEVAGAAALVFAANPLLRAQDVAAILKQTASGHGTWTPELGFGQLDVAAAVARAQGGGGVSVKGVRSAGRLRLRWSSPGALRYRVLVRVDGGSETVLYDATARTSAVVTVRRGHHYVFTIGALDGNGSVIASSAYTVRG
jgi:subtilisin family serine protease